MKNEISTTIDYKGVTYTRDQINEMRSWVKECSWGEAYDDSEVDDLSDITILRGVDREFCGGLSEFIECI